MLNSDSETPISFDMPQKVLFDGRKPELPTLGIEEAFEQALKEAEEAKAAFAAEQAKTKETTTTQDDISTTQSTNQTSTGSGQTEA